MKNINFLVICVLIILFTQFIAAQNPEPTAIPLIEDDDGDVVKISTNLVQMDVVVTDKKGNQIKDLNPEEFEIFVNGKKQEITNFSYINIQQNTSEKAEKPEKKRNKYSVPPPPAKLNLEKIRRTYALVVDDLGLSFENIPAVRQSLRKFINENVQEGDLVAIIRTGSGVGALQSFTNDKRQLLAAVDKIKWNSQGRGGINTFEPIRQSFQEDLKSVGNQVQSPTGSDIEKEFNEEIAKFRNENFSVGSLGGLSYVIQGMRELPGRKAVMFFSEGFPIIVDNKTTRVFDLLKRLADLANRSSVVVYTFDPRGLVNPGFLGANETVTDIFDPATSGTRSNREASFVDSQQSLRFLAEQTGGKSFVNRNLYSNIITEALEDQSGYYLIAYEPDEETFDPEKVKFNKIRIEVKREDLKVRYRNGFYGIPDKKLVTNENKTPGQQIYGALLSPFGANDITLSLNSLFAEDPKGGTFIRSLVSIDANNLKFNKKSDGIYEANFDILALTFNDTGTVIDETAKNYTIRVEEKNLQKFLNKGFIYNLLVPVKKAGAYQFRVALRDSATAKVGSASQFIEIPNLKKNRLTLSSIVLDNYSVSKSKVTEANKSDSNVDFDTAQRRFNKGTVLRYDYVIYNARTNPADLQIKARLYREGKLFLEGKPSQMDTKGQTDLKRLKAVGLITLGENLTPGNYVLQIIVEDRRAKKKKYRNATNWVDFEIVQ